MIKGIIFAFALVLITLLLTAVLVAAQEPCVGEAECYGPPPASSDVPTNCSWPCDDRLNPVADEYYSIYCEHDLVHVWAGLPSSQEISNFPMVRLTGPFPFDAGNGLTVNRVDVTVTISGANGNGPTHPGEKSFSVQECIERNNNPSLLQLPIAEPNLSPTTIDERVGETCTASADSARHCTPWTAEEWISYFISICFPSVVLAPGCGWMLRRRRRRR